MREELNIKYNGHVAYICINELPKNEQQPFKKWLLDNGQTQPIIETEPNEFDCAYPWDYELWKSDDNITHLL